MFHEHLGFNQTERCTLGMRFHFPSPRTTPVCLNNGKLKTLLCSFIPSPGSYCGQYDRETGAGLQDIWASNVLWGSHSEITLNTLILTVGVGLLRWSIGGGFGFYVRSFWLNPPLNGCMWYTIVTFCQPLFYTSQPLSNKFCHVIKTVLAYDFTNDFLRKRYEHCESMIFSHYALLFWR